MKPLALATLASLVLAAPALAQAVADPPVKSTSLDPFGLALLGAGLSGLALSRLLRRRN